MMKTLLTALNCSRLGINRVLSSQKIVSNCRTTDVCNVLITGKCTPVGIKRSLCSASNDDNIRGQKNENREAVGGSVTKSGKYELFKDEDAPLILDVIEERQRIQDLDEEIEEEYDEFAGLNLKHGVTGVFDIEDLVDLLNRENARDIFVAKIPSNFQYVDYIVVVTGRSLKHMLGLAEFVRRVYKIKRHESDAIPRLEGETSKDWLALDLGNIALHIMSKKARPDYDLESLWAVGKEYDEKSNASLDPLAEILKKHAINLDDFQPADTFR